MNWIKSSDRLPKIQEEVKVSDGYRIFDAWIWDHPDGRAYFEYSEIKPDDFIPLFWKPQENSALYLAFEENTFSPRSPK